MSSSMHNPKKEIGTALGRAPDSKFATALSLALTCWFGVLSKIVLYRASIFRASHTRWLLESEGDGGWLSRERVQLQRWDQK